MVVGVFGRNIGFYEIIFYARLLQRILVPSITNNYHSQIYLQCMFNCSSLTLFCAALMRPDSYTFLYTHHFSCKDYLGSKPVLRLLAISFKSICMIERLFGRSLLLASNRTFPLLVSTYPTNTYAHALSTVQRRLLASLIPFAYIYQREERSEGEILVMIDSFWRKMPFTWKEVGKSDTA